MDSFQNFWEKLMLTFDIYTVVAFLIWFFLGVISCIIFLRFIFRKEVRIFKNLGRKIYLLRTGDRDLETEYELLKNNGLFKVYNRILDLRNGITSLQTVKPFSVFVIGYSKDYTQYQEIVSHAMQKNIPLIVIAQPREITDEHMAVFQKYVYFEMCNTPARLLTTIFNLSTITPT